MADKYMMAIDEGTTSTRAVIVDHAGNMVGEAQKEFTQYFPEPGWVEHLGSRVVNDRRHLHFDRDSA